MSQPDSRVPAVARASRRTVLITLVTAATSWIVAGCTSGGATISASTAPQAQSAPQAPAPAQAPVSATPTSASSSQTGSSTVAKSDASTSAPTVVKMTEDFKFDPKTITIPKGATVEWQNSSTQPHTVTDDPSKAMDKANAVLPSGADPWDSGNLDPGKSYQKTFTVAGDYTYFCIPHEAMGMVGKLTVQ